MKILKLYLLLVPIFFAIDMLWLGWLAKGFYQRELANFLAPQVNWAAAAAFYTLYIGGILYFALWPSLQEGSLSQAVLRGALFGFITYATYDLTNMSTLPNWPLSVVIVDILWGSVLCAAVSGLGFWFARGWA